MIAWGKPVLVRNVWYSFNSIIGCFYRKPEIPVNAHFTDKQKHLSLTSIKEIYGGRLLVESH